VRDKEQVLVTVDTLCEIVGPEKFIEGDLGGMIMIFEVPLKVVETLVVAIEGQEIKDCDALVGLLPRKEPDDVLGHS